MKHGEQKRAKARGAARPRPAGVKAPAPRERSAPAAARLGAVAGPDRMQQYLDIAGVIIMALDAEQRVTLINQKGCAVLGWPQEQILGVNWFDEFVPAHCRVQVKNTFAALMRGAMEPVEYFENPVVTRAGEERVIAWHNTLLRDEVGRIAGTLSSGEDVTEHRRAARALGESEERYRRIVELAHEGVWIVDAQSLTTFVNQSMADMLGYTVAEFVGRPALTFLHTDEAADYQERMLARQRGVREVYERRLRHKDGSTVWGLVSSRPLLDAQGAFAGALGMVTNISDRKRAEEDRQQLETQMQHVQKLESLGLLAGGIAHDFNNVLMAILGNADLALTDLPTTSPAQPYLKEIVTASRRATGLCQQMLAYSGKGRFTIELLDLNEAVVEMTHMLEISISKKATLKYNLAKHLPLVEADATQMRQVLMNLITNAAEAIGDVSGVISIATGAMECDEAYLGETYLASGMPHGVYVYLEVADTGCGMSAETKARMFDPFFTTKFTGRGLGMAAVLGIVRGHHGAIKVYSEEGTGSTIKVLLPASGKAPVELPARPRAATARQAGGTVLVADDEVAVRVLATRMLEKLGFTVLAAADGHQALDLYRAHQREIVCVLLDLTMPHLDGEEAFREMRRLDRDVRVIMISGYNEQDVTQRFVGKGLAGFIQKPFQLAALEAKLHEILA